MPSTYSNAFQDSYIESVTLQVPRKAADKYKATEPWYNFKEIVNLELPSFDLKYFIDGELYSKYCIEEGEDIIMESEPIKEGFTFSGWSELPEDMPNHDVVVTGSFIVNQYVVKFIVDDEVISELNLDYGTKIVAPEISKKEGFTFSGWNEMPEMMTYELTIPYREQGKYIRSYSGISCDYLTVS